MENKVSDELELAKEAVRCTVAADGKLQETLYLIKQIMTDEGVDRYKRTLVKIIHLIYMELEPIIFEYFPEAQKELYRMSYAIIEENKALEKESHAEYGTDQG